MGSNCIIKGCRNKPGNKKGMSFHRLKYRLKNSSCSLESVFGPGACRPLTETSRICTEHFRSLPFSVQNAIGIANGTRNGPRSSISPESNHSREGEFPAGEVPELDLNVFVSTANEGRQGAAEEDEKGSSSLRMQLYVSYFTFRHITRALALLRSTMIADPVPGSASDNAMASNSDSKVSLDAVTEEGGGEEEEEESTAAAPKSSSPAPANGDVGLEDDQSAYHKGVKEEEEVHLSSEDEDKLVINESCEKKENLRQEAAAEGPASGSHSELSESSPKSPLKRSAEDCDAPVDMPSKKSRVQEEIEEAAPLSVTQLDESLALLKSDLQALELLMLQKEEEWNSVLRLSKKKEELYFRLLRKKQMLKIRGMRGEEEAEDEIEDEDENVVFLPQGAYSSLGTSQFPLMMLKHILGDSYVPQVVSSSKSVRASRDGASANGPVASPGNVSVIDIHTSHARPSGGTAADVPQISISPDTHSKLGKQLNSMMSMKPILPKPMNSSGSLINTGGVPLPPLSYPSTGYGPQGPTVSVQHLIAAHRKDNPNIPPIRIESLPSGGELTWSPSDIGATGACPRFRGAKRGAWRHRYEGGEKRSSSREPDRPSSVSSSSSETDVRVNASLNVKGAGGIPSSASASSSLLTMTDPSVSYKDVLLQFAQLTQTEKQPGSPQISIIPVSAGESSMRKSDSYPDSTSVTREIPVSSQNSNQSQNLEGSSALAKLLLESGASNHSHMSKPPTVDLSSFNNSPHNLTLSALLSGGTTTTVKEKNTSLGSQMDSRPKKNSASEEGNSNPKCQGCHKNRAQFVCAGCGNQWYCSRPCQVNAWEKHSEHCSS